MNPSLKEILITISSPANLFLIERYISFIKKCNSINFENCYTEKHHILPKSLGGSNDSSNIIKLGSRHHYIAHLLLAKATNNPKMIKALHKMVHSRTGDVQRTYKISSRAYAYLREKHAKIVSNYSKNTVVAKQIGTDEIKRIPTNLFNEYKNILYVALSKDREVSIETRHKKSIASKRPRKCRKGLRSRMVASTKYIYVTPKGKFETKRDILDFYPSFTIVGISNLFSEGRVVNHKFISLHPEFKEFLGKSLNEIGFYRIKKDENN